MIELSAFGRTELKRRSGEELQSILVQPRRFALLCYLALAAPRGFHRRDELLALFWPEQDEEHARGALRQAVYFLRRQLGPDVLVRRGDEEVGVDFQRLQSDVALFEAAIAAGRPADALAFYRGELLCGFHLTGAAEFEQWLARERERLRAAAQRAAAGLFTKAEAEPDLTAAVAWGDRLLELAPENEDVLRRLLTLRTRLGDRSGALRQYESFVERLRIEYELEPTEQTTLLVTQLHEEQGTAPAAAAVVSPVEVTFGRVEPEVEEAKGQGGGRSRGELLGRPGVLRAGSLGRGGHRAIVLGFAGAVVGMAVWLFPGSRPMEGAPQLDPGLIAILPFRLISTDSASAPLGEGMVDLLAMQLGGDGDVRAVDPRTAIAAWERALAASGTPDLPLEAHLAVARGLGAGRLLTGSVVAAAGGAWAVGGSVFDSRDGRQRGEATFKGPVDSLPELADRLLAALLSLDAGEERNRLEDLTSRSVPALAAYLEARREYRHGEFVQAAAGFERALDLDSTFALAAMGLREAVVWGPAQFPSGSLERAERLAWSNRHRLSPRDLLRFRAHAGSRYPEPTPLHEHIQFVEHVLTRIPDDPELWFELGDDVLHAGAMVGIEDWRQRAAAALARAVALDSTYSVAVLHLFDAAVIAGHRAAVRALGTRLLAEDSSNVEIRWVMATLLRDEATLRALRRTRFEGLSALGAARLELNIVTLGLGVPDAELALASLRARAATARERALLLNAERRHALNRGRPAAALHAARAQLAAAASPASRMRLLRGLVYEALYWNGDPAAAAEAVVELDRARTEPAISVDDRLRNLCPAAQWRLARADTAGTGAALDQLASARADPGLTAAHARLCFALLSTQLEALQNGIPSAARLAALDSVLTTNIYTAITADPLVFAGNLVSARMHGSTGNPARGLAAARRRSYPRDAGGMPVMLSSLLREEGRLAAKVGDRAGAIRAYGHYLALRYDPEAILRAEVRQVRAELDALSAARR